MDDPARKTRSGREFSTYGIAPNEAAVLVLAGLDLAPLLKQSTSEESDEAIDFQQSEVEFDCDEGLEEDTAEGHLGPCASHAAPDPPPPPPDYPAPVLTDEKSRRQKGSKKSSHAWRKRKRDADWEIDGHDRRSNTVKGVVWASTPVQVELVAVDLEAAFGGYEAKRRRIAQYRVAVSPSKGLGMGFRLVRADPRKRALAFVDENGFVMGVLCSPPDQISYIQAGNAVLGTILRQGKLASFSKDELDHRRGKFPALNFGVMHGYGTMHPVNLSNGSHDTMIREFRANPNVQRMAKFASAVFQFWGAGVFKYYQKRLAKLFKERPHLERIFPQSIFPCAAVNFGPRVCTFKHRDILNCPFGFCAIQAFGHFDHTRGGHEIFWEAKTIVEFPAHWTLLALSASITHSNSPVGEHETRVSFTQFCPGGLLRFVDNKMRTEAQFEAEDPEGYARMCEKKATRWEWGLKKLSKYNDIVSEAKDLEDSTEY